MENDEYESISEQTEIDEAGHDSCPAGEAWSKPGRPNPFATKGWEGGESSNGNGTNGRGQGRLNHSRSRDHPKPDQIDHDRHHPIESIPIMACKHPHSYYRLIHINPMLQGRNHRTSDPIQHRIAHRRFVILFDVHDSWYPTTR